MSRMLRAALRPALEDIVDGHTHKELEMVFYGRIVRPEELDQAAEKEDQEQWEIKVPKDDSNASGGRIRIRKTIKGEGGTPEYVLTTKTRTSDGGNNEVAIPTTEDHFMQFKYMAHNGMLKMRYVFPVEGTDYRWEVDVFRKPGGGFWEWCKIDLEVDAMGGPVPPFPIELADLITNQEGARSEAEEAKIRSLYEYEFLTKNQFMQE